MYQESTVPETDTWYSEQMLQKGSAASLVFLYLTSPFFLRQGYPCELLSLTVAGIPSMHICLDFIPELIAQPELEKQVVTVLELEEVFDCFSVGYLRRHFYNF